VTRAFLGLLVLCDIIEKAGGLGSQGYYEKEAMALLSFDTCGAEVGLTTDMAPLLPRTGLDNGANGILFTVLQK